MIEFKLNGRQMSLSDAEVNACISGHDPEPVRQHAVEINGQLFPMKQAFALATGLDRLDFTTNQARTQLKRLGYRVVRIGDTS
jgi:hypothetical protein